MFIPILGVFNSSLILGEVLHTQDYGAVALIVVAIALVLAVASVTSVGFFADRLHQALTGEARQLLGADVVLVSISFLVNILLTLLYKTFLPI